MVEPGSPVFQAFCTACKHEIDVSILEPLDTFACSRCLTIQTFGQDQTRPAFVDPVPRRVVTALLLLQIAIDSLVLWRLQRLGGSVGTIPIVAVATMAASVVFFLRVKSPPLNAGFALLSISVALAFVAMRGFPTERAGGAEEWTVLVFALAAILSLGLVFMVGELLRISRLPRA
ncbi:MAG: hypothetical protein HYT87_12205 [Nitrospirae bacterium]|nr:hypothetical protein [Nitrospirota bacterium]